MIPRMMYACHWVTHNDTEANMAKTFGVFIHENRQAEMAQTDWNDPDNVNRCIIDSYSNWH